MGVKSTGSGKGVGKRAYRSARIKVDIFRGLLKLAGKRQLDEISVEELCETAGISKVTFFKYFPQKEDVLFYFIRIWCFDRALELTAISKSGMHGIYFIFERMAETYDRYPGLVMSTLAAIAGQKRPSVPMALKLPERQLLSPGSKNLRQIQVLSLPQMLEKYLMEAIMNREIKNVGDTRDLSLLFLSIFYGTLLARHNRSTDNVRSEYRRHIELMLNGLKETRRF